MRSIRFRITLAATIVMFVAMIAVAAVLITVMRTALLDEIETSITNEAYDFAANTEFIEDLEFAQLPTDFETLLVVIDEDGEILTTNDAEVMAIEITDTLDLTSVRSEELLFGSLSLSQLTETDGEENMRAAYTTMNFIEFDDQLDFVPADTKAWVVVARSLNGVERTVETLQRYLLGAVPLLTLFVAVLTWWLTGRALAPVDRMRHDLDQITATSLQQRVSHPDSNDEISRLGVTMNGMLERLEESHVRQERFVSDAAHELRTPLASMAAQLDVDARHPHTANPETTATRVRAEVTRLQDLVESLLTLARTGNAQQATVTAGSDIGDAVSDGSTRVRVDLDDLATVSAHRVKRAPHIALTVQASSGLVALADERSLERAVENLIANAFRHTATQVHVSVEASPEDSQAVLHVDDDGTGIDPADGERIFDRFVRLDEARSRDAGGTGLGLALARDVAEAHGGSLITADSPLGGARFELRLPTVQS